LVKGVFRGGYYFSMGRVKIILNISMLIAFIFFNNQYLRGEGTMFFLSRLRGCFFLVLLFFGGLQFSFSEVIQHNFDSEADFNTFWNVSTWGISDVLQYSADNVSIDENDGVLVLKLSASPPGTTPVCGEVTSKRNDFLYGSYRASIKVCTISGSVIGWFVYKDGIPGDGDLHEIDVEYLTENLSRIHFTLHHDEYCVEHQVKPVPFDPAADFHEYRFDWYPDKVEYYIDSDHVATLTIKVPDAACTIMLNHWSKNLADWGGPAPTEDTYMYIDYMHYYSDPSAVTEQGTNTSTIPWRPLIVSRKNSLVEITFENVFPGEVIFNVFSMNGKRVTNIVSDYFSVGTQIFQWDAAREANGVYYLDINSRGVSQKAVFRLVR